MSIFEELEKEYTFPKGYGKFPYIILKAGYAMCMQIPIHLVGDSDYLDFEEYPGSQLLNVPLSILKLEKQKQITALHDRLIEHTQLIYNKIEKERGKLPRLCLVEDENTAYYFNNGEIKENSKIPSGGTLLNQLNQPIKMTGEHYIKRT
jgi:methyl coenzyme M reductase subunit C-like uncharacterized protein (methanogenesis marker protein 7)